MPVQIFTCKFSEIQEGKNCIVAIERKYVLLVKEKASDGTNARHEKSGRTYLIGPDVKVQPYRPV
jgi:hypothetical protein